MESSAAVVSESPNAKGEAKNEEIIIGSGGNMKENSTKAIIVAVVAAATTTDQYHGNVVSITSSAKTESPQEIKKVMMKKKMYKVQVSNNKKPFIFYLNLATRYINEFNEVELCGLGMAIPTVVTIAEILKRNGVTIQKGIMTSTVLTAQEDKKGRRIEKAKIEITLGKADKLDNINLAAVSPMKADAQKA